MSTNYYVHTPEGTEIHLGKTAAGWPFLFRGYTGSVETYDTWLAILDLGEIRDEYGVSRSKEDLVALIEELRPNGRWHHLLPGQIRDDAGNTFSPYEFC